MVSERLKGCAGRIGKGTICLAGKVIRRLMKMRIEDENKPLYGGYGEAEKCRYCGGEVVEVRKKLFVCFDCGKKHDYKKAGD